MATTVIGICNMALTRLGESKITLLDEDSKAANLCNLWYERARDEALESHDWACAISRQSLARDAEAPITSDYAYQYALPVDPYCLRILNVPATPTAAFEVAGRMLLTNETAIIIRYIARVVDPTLFSPLLVKAIAWRLAADIAYALTGNKGKETEMEALYRDALQTAGAIDAEGSTEPPVEDTSWHDAGR